MIWGEGGTAIASPYPLCDQTGCPTCGCTCQQMTGIGFRVLASVNDAPKMAFPAPREFVPKNRHHRRAAAKAARQRRKYFG